MADNIKEVLTPDLGMDKPVPIAEIFVEVGQQVSAEEPLLGLESDKAVMEIPSPYSGTVTEILVEEEQEIGAGTPLVKIEVEGEEGADSTADQAPAEKAPEAAPAPETAQTSPEPAKASTPAPAPASAATPAAPSVDGRKSHASPSVRLYARELGVDLATVVGTGPKNRIRKEDVQAYVKDLVAGNVPSTMAASGGGSGLPALPFVDPAGFGPVHEESLTPIQKISGQFLHASWVNIPHVTHYDKSDVTELEAWRKTLNSQEKGDRKYTPLAFVIKALTVALKRYPRFNSVLSPEGKSIILRDYVNVGIAVDTPKGLLVPVIKDTDKKGLGEIADEIIELATLGREGKIKPDQLKGGSITITNLGGIGGTSFTPIINPPEVAILGLSRSQMEPRWNGSEFEPKLMLPLSLSYDHRVIDGALAATFTAYLARILTDPRNMLL